MADVVRTPRDDTLNLRVPPCDQHSALDLPPQDSPAPIHSNPVCRTHCTHLSRGQHPPALAQTQSAAPAAYLCDFEPTQNELTMLSKFAMVCGFSKKPTTLGSLSRAEASEG